MKERTYILLSVPKDFMDKFIGFISNVNMLNDNSTEPPIKVEKVYVKKKQEFAVTPKVGKS